MTILIIIIIITIKSGSHEPFLFDKFSLTSFICPCEQGKLPFFHLSSFYLFKITKKLAKKKLAK